MEAIREELEELDIQNYEQKSFVLYDALKGLLVQGKVTALIKDLSDRGQVQVYQRDEIVESILANGLRVFATLLFLSRPELILKFMEKDHLAHGQLDSRLPLSESTLELILKDEKLCARFYRQQWRFLVPFFRTGQSHREFEDNTRLPFVNCEQLGEGGFGEVHKLTLLASCQDLLPEREGEVCVVRKRMKRKGDTAPHFQREQHILSLLRCLRHPNIIQILAAYTIHQTHNFLFPLADGDLKSFFRQVNRPLGFETDNDVFQALYELASAIEAVHNYFSEAFNVRKIGCHYDLKPENVLYRSGKLILSDFGLSRLSEEDDGSKSLYRNGGGEYMAPECVSVQDDFQKFQVGRSSDMWSFGCILSEMLTYLQEGPSGIREFSERREIVFAGFWACKAFHGGDKAHEGVVQWLCRLNRATTTKYQDKLMTLVQDLLEMEPSKRPKAQAATFRLFEISQQETYSFVDEIFQRLLAMSDLELRVEYERFRLWGEYTGFKDNFDLLWRSNYQGKSQNFTDLQVIREGIFKLRIEVESLSRVLESTSPKAFRLYYHLQKAIDNLWDTQPSSMRFSMTNDLENRLLSTDDKVELESLEAVFHPAAKETSVNPGAVADASNGAAYRRIGLLAAMKQIASALDDRTQSADDMYLKEQYIKRPIKWFHWHLTGIYQPPDTIATQVLIERLEYDSSWVERTDELIQRIREIASSRAISTTGSTFPVLTCAGYYHDLGKHLFDMVYNFPPKPAKTASPIPDVETLISLRDILATVKSRRDRPSLDHVFEVAVRMISLVLTMHRANWVHKNISSYNIIFFPDRFNSIAEAMTSPYFIGFSYSRLNLQTAFTQGPNPQLEYQHPEYLRSQKRFCQEHEYYSVGLVLLELGFWAPLEEITQGITGTPEELKEILLERRVPILKTYMGSAYAEAVAACLSGDFGGSSRPVDVREAFERKVLQRIQKRNV